jgi:hypothetical protein
VRNQLAIDFISTNKRCYSFGVDLAFHNYLYYSGILHKYFKVVAAHYEPYAVMSIFISLTDMMFFLDIYDVLIIVDKSVSARGRTNQHFSRVLWQYKNSESISD